LALKLDKEALLENIVQYKDQLFIAVLVIIIAVGGWFLYLQSSQSVEQIINEVTTPASPGGAGGPQANGTQELQPEQIVSQIIAKRSSEFYQADRNPFGSPEEQLQKRQQLEESYSRGVDLYKQGQYEAAIGQFDRVISMDVTETRINYPILPSEYKRRAQRENAKENFDRIYQSAQSDIAEGDRLLAAGNQDEALNVYNRANDNLRSVIDSDPQGEAIGEENLQKLKALQSQVSDKLRNLLSTVLQQQVDQSIAQANQVLNGNDYIALTKTLFQLGQVKTQLQQNDPNATLIPRQKHTQLDNIIQQINQKIQTGVATLTSQAQESFAQGLANNDLQATQDAVRAMNQALQVNPQDETFQNQISSMVTQRADMVIQMVQSFIQSQQQVLKQENYDEFDQDQKRRFIQELAQLKSLGGMLDSAKRGTIAELEKQLAALRLPPPVTQAYVVTSINETSPGQFEITVTDKTSRNNIKRTLRRMEEGNRDRTTGITLKQVDTDNGFVILSKSGYTDSKVALPSNN